MRWYGKELTVTKGESFSLTCKISTKEGVPYMISSAMKNPTFLVTVSNTLYKSDDKQYLLKCWTPLVTRDTFPGEIVDELPEEPDPDKLYYLTTAYTDSSSRVYQPGCYAYNDVTEEWFAYTNFVNGYVFDNIEPINVENFANDNPLIDKTKRYLYHLTTQYSTYSPGYYIWDIYGLDFVKYETIFIQNFPTEITKDWINKNYYYDVHLLGGEFTYEFSKALHDNTLLNFNDNPFSKITNDFTIIPKTQLNVLSKL